MRAFSVKQLFIISIFLVYLLYKNQEKFSYNFSTLRSKNVNGLVTEMHNDEYCVGYNFLNASESFREDHLEPVTLAIHGTSDILEMVDTKPSNWDGPISLGLFVDLHSSNALQYLADVHRCDAEFRKKVTVHIAFRLSAFQTSCPVITIAATNVSCEDFLKSRSNVLKNITAPFLLYPSNLMRNVARIGAKSNIHFIADGDMILSEGFAAMIKPIANKVLDGRSKKVLVVSGHQIKNLTQWFDISKKSKNITSWEIPYSSCLWEVQPILHRNDLYNKDYFPSRIKVMQSLVYNLCRANYTFHLLSHVFDVHEGIKYNDTIYSQSVIAHQKKFARNTAYKRYVRELNEVYPDTLKKCGDFIM